MALFTLPCNIYCRLPLAQEGPGYYSTTGIFSSLKCSMPWLSSILQFCHVASLCSRWQTSLQSPAYTLLIVAFKSHVPSKLTIALPCHLSWWTTSCRNLSGTGITSTCFGFVYIGLFDFLMWYVDSLVIYDIAPLYLYYNLKILNHKVFIEFLIGTNTEFHITLNKSGSFTLNVYYFSDYLVGGSTNDNMRMMPCQSERGMWIV